MADHTKKYWNSIAVNDPYFGVLTNIQFKGKVLKKHCEKEYNDSGLGNVHGLLKIIEDLKCYHSLNLNTAKVMDFGSGTGRMAQHMCKLCKKLTCVDISEIYLTMIANLCKNNNITNIDTCVYEKLHTIDKQDLIYSLIVLQHNPPDIIKFIVKQICDLLEPNGMAIIHIPYDSYTQRKIDTSGNVMEMHIVPKKEIIHIINTNNCTLEDIIETDYCGKEFKNCIYVWKKNN